MVFYAAFNNISVISQRQLTSFMSLLGFTSTRLGSEVSCPSTLPRKNSDHPVQLKPRTPGLRVKHFTTEPHGTLSIRTNLHYDGAFPLETIGSCFRGMNPAAISDINPQEETAYLPVNSVLSWMLTFSLTSPGFYVSSVQFF